MPLATPRRQMPATEAVRELLANMLGREIELTERAAEIKVDDPELDCRSAIFVDDSGTCVAACVTDVALAAYSGAALAMIPKAVADDAIKAKAIGEGLADNAKELANVGAGLLNGPSVAHVKLRDVVHEVPDEVKDLIVKAKGRMTWDVTIADYGTGVLGVYAT